MLTRYRAAFEPRGSLSFSSAGVLGRLPASMVGLGLVLFLSAKGNYGLAGTLIGVQALAACVGGPAQGRLADRFGQARTLVPAALLFGVTLTALILGLRDGLAFAGLAILAGLVGASSPTTGTLARSRWSALHRPGAALQTAFAVEAVFDEVVFVTGPVLATFLATRTDPLLALVVGGSAGVVGSLLLAAQRGTQPPVARRDSSRTVAAERRGRLPYGVLAPLLIAQLTIGAIFGSVDVVTVAEATVTGHRQLAGLILACFSGGSLVAGLVVGAVSWRLTPMRRVRIFVSILGVSTLLLPLVPSVQVLPLAGFVVGLTVSPALVALAAAVQAVTPADRLTEAMATATAALVGGFSLGSAVAGHLVDVVGPHRAYFQSAATGLIAMLAVLAPAVAGRVAPHLTGRRRATTERTPTAAVPTAAAGSTATRNDPTGQDSTAGDAATQDSAAPDSTPPDSTARDAAAREAAAQQLAARVLPPLRPARRPLFPVRPRRAGVFRRADRHAPGPRRTNGRLPRH